MKRRLTEVINKEADLVLKLKTLPEAEVFQFMSALQDGAYFNMGMFSSIPVAKAYKDSIRICKVVEMVAIVSGVGYEDIETTKEFRDATGKAPSVSWYDHLAGYENKVGVKKSDTNSKYVLWTIKAGSNTNVRYYVVDLANDTVIPVTKQDVAESIYLTQSEKTKLQPRPVTGFDLKTGALVENETVWRTAAFDHIFWLSQSGKATQEYGLRFEEDFNTAETELFIDGNQNVETDLDAILAGNVETDPFTVEFPELY